MLGCGGGELGADLKQRNPQAQVTGITSSPVKAARARIRLDRVFERNLDENRLGDIGSFDCII